MYRQGPFRKAKPEYGYQLPLTPRQLFEAGIVATNANPISLINNIAGSKGEQSLHQQDRVRRASRE
jgi:hypothetical protein